MTILFSTIAIIISIASIILNIKTMRINNTTLKNNLKIGTVSVDLKMSTEEINKAMKKAIDKIYLTEK